MCEIPGPGNYISKYLLLMSLIPRIGDNEAARESWPDGPEHRHCGRLRLEGSLVFNGRPRSAETGRSRVSVPLELPLGFLCPLRHFRMRTHVPRMLDINVIYPGGTDNLECNAVEVDLVWASQCRRRPETAATAQADLTLFDPNLDHTFRLGSLRIVPRSMYSLQNSAKREVEDKKGHMPSL